MSTHVVDIFGPVCTALYSVPLGQLAATQHMTNGLIQTDDSSITCERNAVALCMCAPHAHAHTHMIAYVYMFVFLIAMFHL